MLKINAKIDIAELGIDPLQNMLQVGHNIIFIESHLTIEAFLKIKTH